MAPTAQSATSPRPVPRTNLQVCRPNITLPVRKPPKTPRLSAQPTQPTLKTGPKINHRVKVGKEIHQRMKDINECPYRILALRRNESKREDFGKILKIAHEDIVCDKKNREEWCKNTRNSTKNWAVEVLRTEKLRMEHHSTARSRECHCILAWERLTDPEQAFLIKHQDCDHRVPGLSNLSYDHSQDYPHEIGEPMTPEHEEFHDLYNAIWEKYDQNREDDDEPNPVENTIPKIEYESAFGSPKSFSP